MPKSTLYILLFSALTFAAGCKKNAQTLPLHHTDFPTSIGSWWRYQVVNNNTNAIDTMTSTVSRGFGLNGVISYLWINTYTSGIASDTVVVNDMDTAISFSYFGYSNGYLSDLYLRFPIAAGHDWAEPEASNESVAALGSYTVLGRSYPNVTLLTCMHIVPDDTKIDSDYISPHIGIIRRKKEINGWGLYSNTISLIDYHIAN